MATKLTPALLVVGALTTAILPAQRIDTERWNFIRDSYDKNEDGEVTEAEYPRGKRSFANLDANKDGKLTSADFERSLGGPPKGSREAENSPETFFDWFGSFLNTDGKPGLRREEWDAAFGRVFGDAETVEFGAVIKLAGDEVTGPMGSHAKPYLARRLGAFDLDRDQKIRREELDPLFESLDKNEDGVLAQGDEVHLPPAVGQMAPDFELVRADDPKQKVKLSSFRGDKPVALIFGSYT